ncbi:MAG: PH domain-containing protein [Candidatus Moranbacteria bacterium]|nr:PH domain-containing protein [Candidatus Moranbacteria bacterium]MBP9801318.1 PH domain-containing protein [Candidatus Moranbacteria bacterium]
MSRFSRYHFQGQRENEELLRIIHRHWFNIFLQYVGIWCTTLLLIVVFSLLPQMAQLSSDALQPAFLAFLLNTFLLFIWLYAFLVWVDYYFDVWIITSQRIVNIEQKGLFNREVSELQFSRIQDVTSVVDGFIPTILNFGDVYVQTAAEEERFVFRQIPDPYTIKDMVMQLSRSSTPEEARKINEKINVGKYIA